MVNYNLPPTCKNPAIGINVIYRNMSGIPVAIGIDGNKFKLSMGNKAIIERGKSEVDLAGTGEVSLPPGRTAETGGTSPDFPDIYKRLHGVPSTAYPTIKLLILYRSLITGKHYQYNSTIEVLDDCNHPEIHHWLTLEETIKETK